MAGADDPAVVLEQFTNDASNLAPEITHLMEEIEAKDRTVRECEAAVKQRDQSLQRHVKVTGGVSGSPFPREDHHVKTVMEHYDRALSTQDEKVALAEKACTLLARHTKRLDAMIRELATNGGLELDDTLTGLLNGTAATMNGVNASFGANKNGTNGAPGANGVSLAHVANGGAASTAPPSSTLANSNLARLVTQGLNSGSNARSGSPVGTPTSATQARSAREGSTDASKRRRLNIPAQGSNLRQSSTGPGTPKAGTPQPRDGGRAGSVPRGTNKKDKSGPGGGNKLLVPPKGGQVNPDSKAAKARKKKGGGGSSGGGGGGSQGGRSNKKGGVSDADDSALSNAGDESGSERLSAAGGDLGRTGKDGTGDERDGDGDVDMAGLEDDDEGGDTNLYCTCRSVSYGNMVACDSDDCPYEWFHWNCVGLSKEPPGKWYCDECKKRLGMTK